MTFIPVRCYRCFRIEELDGKDKKVHNISGSFTNFEHHESASR